MKTVVCITLLTKMIIAPGCNITETKPERKHNSALVSGNIRAVRDLTITYTKKTAASKGCFNSPDSFYYCSSGGLTVANLSIKKPSVAPRQEMPDSLEFELMLNGKYQSDKISGVAVLSSNNESFSDPDEVDGGDYFAADYYFKKGGIKIRMDIETYQACIVDVDAHSAASYFLKK